MMRRVIDMEAHATAPKYIELFKGTDLRRTLIVAGVYAAQNLTGNLIANQAVYFFERKPLEAMHTLVRADMVQRPACRRTRPSR